MKVKECTYNEIFDNKNFDKLTKDYSLEAEIKSLSKGTVNKEYYKRLHENKQIFFIGIFDDNGLLVGMCFYLCCNYPHSSKNVLWIESIYIQREYRTVCSSILFKKIFKFAKECKCYGVLIEAPYNSEFAVSCEKYFKPASKIFYHELIKD